ncbi:hypothetical protein ACP4OV_029358 [Aristida adscensionis]
MSPRKPAQLCATWRSSDSGATRKEKMAEEEEAGAAAAAAAMAASSSSRKVVFSPCTSINDPSAVTNHRLGS